MKARHLVTRVLPFVAAVVFLAMTASAAFAGSATLPLTVTAGGKSFPVSSSLVTSGSVDTTGVTAFVGAIANAVYCKPANAIMRVNTKKKQIVFAASRVGYQMTPANKTAAIALLSARLVSETATSPASTLALPTTMTKPKITKFGKNILVSLSQRKIYLYDNMKVVKTYRCAVGQKAWPTPTGVFHIGKKNPHPTWTNGYASWSKSMPAFIGPGPNNPLGTRALYVYNKHNKDTGVRFHGVPHSEDSSIGHAASHGCLRMHRKDVENFYPRVPVGTMVYIIK